MDDIGLLLIASAEQIAKRGWCQGYEDLGTKRCAYLAMLDVAVADGDFSEGKVYAMCRRMYALIGDDLYADETIVDWNDMPERTAEEVMDVLIAAAYV